MTQTMTGGCQCGRIRYTVQLGNNEAYLCHCRMCQKATGGFAAAFVGCDEADLVWETEPDWFDSSPVAQRPFCSQCGTPLGFRFRQERTDMDLTLGSFDEPAFFVPVAHAGCESIHEAWLDTKDLPRHFSASTPSVAKAWNEAGLEVPE